MNELLESIDLDDLHNLGDKKHTVTVTLDKGDLRKIFGDRINPLYGLQIYRLNEAMFLGNVVYLEIKILSKVEKINVFFAHREPNEDIYNSFERNSDVNGDLLMKRAIHILGFSLATYIRNSSVLLFRGAIKNYDVIYNISHHELIKELEENIQLTGDIDEDVISLFNYYWYKFPFDLTGMDKEIIKISMETGLVLNN